MIRLAPHETLVGDCAAVADALAVWRTDPATLAATAHPDHVFRPLPERLERWKEAGVVGSLFHSGLYLARNRYAELGLRHMLPLDRVLVGAESTRPGAFGGFHHRDQGYRHLQMAALITMYGPVQQDAPADPELAMLDLVRAYAHDCLHYGSARRYVLAGGEVVRTQYGINWRQPNGRTYSSSDPQDATHTRNLGVVMEGACDREARRLTRQVANLYNITGPDSPDTPGWWAYRDVTGQLDDGEPPAVVGERIGGEAGSYVESMGRYQAGVNARYERWLDEFGAGEAERLHDLVLTATIGGDSGILCHWLDSRHGPGTFSGVFQAGGYLAAPLREAAI
ncbi:hypothetical protein ABZ723_15905 [Streptomyces sp. NPDC006700]|uniref:hypothetical protein n=1 Tax=unclassified Streptomyces TaxID=2593676 RepID=UPI0033C13009